ncbi:MAG TPA: nicotinate-nucleotide adenylyltransferase [Nitriliruptorales bacterium]|nr:nicotinate-nucleotide adenylyltransferase [Nitriliruptorales bacterium]
MVFRPPPRIGLLGGTFDPPHVGHLIVAEVARVKLGLQQVQFVVAGQPWMKGECSPTQHRIRMVELAIEDNDAFVVNRSEVDRGGNTYTVDTLLELSAQMPGADFMFLVGADAAMKMPKWVEVEKALELATFVALTRPGHQLELHGPVLGRLRHLQVPPIDLSSTDIRRRFREGQAVRYQIPDAVGEYVRQQGLYQASGA